MDIKVKISDIDYCVEKQDALIVYMKNRKVWVCTKNQQLPQSKEELFVTLKLKTDKKRVSVKDND